MKKIINILIIAFAVICFLSVFYIVLNYKADNKQIIVFEELKEIATIQKEEINGEQKEKQRNLQSLYELNNDFVGWLEIEDTNISYPVMQTSNSRKDYYLYKNFYKEYSQIGTPYIAENCNIKECDNLIIYGHNIINYQMFGELEKYKKADFYNKHKIIKFNTLYDNADYEIIAVFKTVLYSSNCFKYYKYNEFENEREFDTFIQKCNELSFFEIENEAHYGEKLITLSTCDNSCKNGRLVVVAKKVNN